MDTSQEFIDWVDDIFTYAERNIVGYKRPADYLERTARVLEGKRNPMIIPSSNGHHSDN